MKHLLLKSAALFCLLGLTAASQKPLPAGWLTAKHAIKAPVIDGKAADACWKSAAWHPMNQRWIGPEYSPSDFTGRYKAAWDSNYIYILAEITDDTLTDTHPDGLEKYWDDDCLEVFFDEDRSKGIHTFSYNAFAYHIGLDNKVVDTSPEHKAAYYPEHAFNRRITKGNVSIWEVRFKIFPDTYTDQNPGKPVTLRLGKKLGFAIAYCDNDHSTERENFIGSIPVAGTDKNKGYIDAGIFGEMELVK